MRPMYTNMSLSRLKPAPANSAHVKKSKPNDGAVTRVRLRFHFLPADDLGTKTRVVLAHEAFSLTIMHRLCSAAVSKRPSNQVLCNCGKFSIAAGAFEPAIMIKLGGPSVILMGAIVPDVKGLAKGAPQGLSM